MMAKAAAGGRRLAAQILVSVVATGTAALVVPQILGALGYGRAAPAAFTRAAPVAAPADFEAAFVWPVQTPPTDPAPSMAALPAAAGLPATAPVPMRAPRSLQAAHRARPAPRLAAIVPQVPAGEPLQLAAMAAPAPAPEAGRSLLGIPIPKLPYEDRIVAPLARARDAVRGLF